MQRKTPHRAPNCPTTGKLSYYALKDAKLAIRRMRTSRGRSLLRAYRCDDCNHFHIGHKPGRIVQPRQEAA